MVLTFNEFANYVVENIKDFLPKEFENASFSTREVYKPNTKLTGLYIAREDSKISPVVYIDSFYESYENGESLDSVLDKIASLINKGIAEIPTGVDINNILIWDNVKDKVLPKLINLENNKNLLETLPYSQLENLAIVYYIRLSDEATVPVTLNLIKEMGITESTLHEYALKNLSATVSLKSMIDTIMEMMVADYNNLSPEEKESVKEDFPMPSEEDKVMYVLTNNSKVFGAAAMLDTDTMDNIFNKFGNFFILPSSLHELIVVPSSSGISVSDFEKMVTEVNDTQVPEEDILSYNVYSYDAVNKKVVLAKEDMAA